ncbi:MAG: ABC transporter permease [Saccharofermentanales bacterium]|jgi:peptide/nickel transport system permease protein
MIKYIIKRVLWIIPVLLGVLFIVFTIDRLTPGDPVVALLGSNYTQEQYDMKKAELGLDEPFFIQFYNYVKNIVTKLDFGISYTNKRPVLDEVMDRFPVTLKLGLMGVFITVIIGVPLGIVSATKQNSVADYCVTSVSIFFASMPNFWLAIMLIIIFSLQLKIFPATGLGSWESWVLPALALGLSPIASVTRMTRSSMLEVIRQDYIRTARAKGLAEGTVIRKHAVHNSMVTVVTVVGFQLSMIMGGSVIVESIFAIPGIGTLMMSAINSKNYPIIEGCVLMIAIAVCVMNLLVDLIYGFVDPRIMAQYSRSKKKKEGNVIPQKAVS